MSANFTVLLVAAGFAVAAGSAAVHAARGTRRELVALRRELAACRVPAPRDRTEDDVRAAVAAALADERERELAEARAFWAEQEARESAGEATLFPGGLHGAGSAMGPQAAGDYEVPPVLPPFLPRQADAASREAERPQWPDRAEAAAEAAETAGTAPAPGTIPHPSGPDFAPSPVVASQDQTADRLADLAAARIPLSDVRPGPLGTLDVYIFADGTTLCMTPGHRETAEQLTEALDRGELPVLHGGSAIAGAYALTFAYGDQSVFVLADRVVASL